MKGIDQVFSSASDDWGTPQALFDRLNQEFQFTVDVCATKENTKTRFFFSPEDDGLKVDWDHQICFMNPPYSQVDKWIKKAIHASTLGATVVCLVAARVDTKWFWDLQMEAAEIRFLKGRLKFEGAGDNGAPFPSAIVILRPTIDHAHRRHVWWWDWRGKR